MSDTGPKASLTPPSCGGALTEADYRMLGASWITPELADAARLRRVDSLEGRDLVSQKGSGDFSGIVFPFIWPGEDHIREYWLRRDRPEVEYDADGKSKERRKYLGPPGGGNLLYIMPGTRPEFVSDLRVPIAITEGAKKTIALHRLSWHGLDENGEFPRFLPVGLSGVWFFRGTIGKVDGPDGSRRDQKGLIADLRRSRPAVTLEKASMTQGWTLCFR